jgi:hypothetical protein
MELPNAVNTSRGGRECRRGGRSTDGENEEGSRAPTRRRWREERGQVDQGALRVGEWVPLVSGWLSWTHRHFGCVDVAPRRRKQLTKPPRGVNQTVSIVHRC